MKAHLSILLFIQISISALAVSQTTVIENTLRMAGKNRPQLQKVLDHYRSDSLKYRAACFLIENMDIHYSQTYYWADSLNRKVSFNELDYSNYELSTFALENLRKIIPGVHAVPVINRDVDVIKSDFLIKNIEAAFDSWKDRKGLPFSEFCEYLLPYRVANEPLQDWREIYKENFGWIEDCVKINNAKSPSKYVLDYMLEKFKDTYNREKRIEPLPRLGAMQLLHRMKGPCEDIADMEIFILRSQGYAASQEIIPYWATTSGSHLLASVRVNDLQKHVSLEIANVDSLKDKQFWREPSKVIRSTYSKQPGVLAEFEAADQIPNNFMRLLNYKDVTSQYWPAKDLSCPLTHPVTKKIVYACVLNYQIWQPTWWAKTDGDSATFTNMPKGVVYLPAYYENNKIIPAGFPVVLGYNHQEVLRPDTVNLRSVTITQQEKYLKFRPYKQYKLMYWDKEWKVTGSKTTEEDTQELIFKDVPSNTLFILIPEYSERKERPFIITNQGERVWF